MEVEIEYLGKKEKVLLKEELNYGEHNDILKQTQIIEISEELDKETNKTESKSISKFNRPLYNELKLVAFIKKAPFEIDLENVRKLPLRTAIVLLNKVEEIDKINIITEDDVKKS